VEKTKYNQIRKLECRGIAHKEEKINSVLNEKQIKIAAITESKKKLQGTMETNNYTVIYSDVNSST
jgi:hypothetical protein